MVAKKQKAIKFSMRKATPARLSEPIEKEGDSGREDQPKRFEYSLKPKKEDRVNPMRKGVSRQGRRRSIRVKGR